MYTVTFHCSPAIWFRFDLADANIPTFPLEENVDLLHPLLVDEVSDISSNPMEGMVAFGVDDRCYLAAARIALVVKNEPQSFRLLEPVFQLLCRKLRFLARQTWLPPEVMAMSIKKMGEEFHPSALSVAPYFPTSAGDGSIVLRKAFVESAVTLAHLEAMQALPDDFAVPAYVDLLLDAIHAHDTRDYRRAILYAAIAVDAVATETLSDAYATVVVGGNPDPRFRVITTSERGGSRTADPVYEVLERNDKLRGLLHERPLYLLGRSMVLEDKPLYDRLDVLFKSRNLIAHGQVPGGAGTLDLSQAGALDAVLGAKAAFAWFGKDADYSIDEIEFVELRREAGDGPK